MLIKVSESTDKDEHRCELRIARGNTPVQEGSIIRANEKTVFLQVSFERIGSQDLYDTDELILVVSSTEEMFPSEKLPREDHVSQARMKV